MRSVVLSSFLDQRATQGQFRSSLQTALSFTRVLEKLQNTSRSLALSRSFSQSQLSKRVPQHFTSTPETLTRESTRLTSTPQLTQAPRFLPPLSVNGKSVQSRSQDTAPANAPQDTAASSEQGAAVRTYGAAIMATSRLHGVDPTLSLAVARAESGVGTTKNGEIILNPRAVSRAGAVGLFQLMDATGKEKLQEIAPEQRYNPFNPSQNIHLGVSYLKEMAETFSNNTQLSNTLFSTPGANEQEARRLAVAAYNAGPGRVARAQKLARARGQNPAHYHNIERYLPQETRQYVRKVERFTTEFRGNDMTRVTNSEAAAAETQV